MMLNVGNFEYSQGDLLGHGAFALVFKGRRKKVGCSVSEKEVARCNQSGKRAMLLSIN